MSLPEPTTSYSADEDQERGPRPSKGVFIPINAEWRISSDEHQYIIEKRKGTRRTGRNKGTPIWAPVFFHRTLDTAVLSVLDRHIRTERLRDLPDNWIDAVHHVLTQIDTAKRQIIEALQEAFK